MWNKWDEENLEVEALKYGTRTEFQKKSYGAYQAAWRRGLLSQICSHMTENYSHNKKERKWNLETLKAEASKYKTRKEFRQKNDSAYNTALRKNVLDVVCEGLAVTCFSGPEIELLNMVKQRYPAAKTLRDRQVKIKNKPHIGGFDIDIFIPEINKGIEFDGKYYHSLQGLAKNRKHWPIQDVEKYHEIKDRYFLSKGIVILHIAEKDWLTDKEQCISRIFNFIDGQTSVVKDM